jgi:hypothetical protein
VLAPALTINEAPSPDPLAPTLTATEPLDRATLDDETIEIVPTSPAVAVPVEIPIDPELPLVLTDDADLIVISPLLVTELTPLAMFTLPPAFEVLAPATIEISEPIPLELLPTIKSIDPAEVPIESPLERMILPELPSNTVPLPIEISPLLSLPDPDDNTRSPPRLLPSPDWTKVEPPSPPNDEPAEILALPPSPLDTLPAPMEI